MTFAKKNNRHMNLRNCPDLFLACHIINFKFKHPGFTIQQRKGSSFWILKHVLAKAQFQCFLFCPLALDLYDFQHPLRSFLTLDRMLDLSRKVRPPRAIFKVQFESLSSKSTWHIELAQMEGGSTAICNISEWTQISQNMTLLCGK